MHFPLEYFSDKYGKILLWRADLIYALGKKVDGKFQALNDKGTRPM